MMASIRVGDMYDTYDQFAKVLKNFEKRTFATFNRANSERAECYNKKRINKMPLECVYSRVTFECSHYDNGISARSKRRKLGITKS